MAIASKAATSVDQCASFNASQRALVRLRPFWNEGPSMATADSFRTFLRHADGFALSALSALLPGVPRRQGASHGPPSPADSAMPDSFPGCAFFFGVDALFVLIDVASAASDPAYFLLCHGVALLPCTGLPKNATQKNKQNGLHGCCPLRQMIHRVIHFRHQWFASAPLFSLRLAGDARRTTAQCRAWPARTGRERTH